ncbi:MAG: T9SS type A sorting domain-containing protein [Bacteroidota bacterium]
MYRLVLVSWVALIATPLAAQTYTLERSTVAAGATSVLSGGGAYALGSTVGEAAASVRPATGGTYSVDSGFWAGLSPFGVVQPSGTPIVSVPPPRGVVRPTDTFDLPVVVGSAATPASDLFGVSFDLMWDPTRFALVAVAAPEPTTSGGLGDCDGDAFSDLLTLNRVNAASVQYSVTRRADRCSGGVNGEITVVTLSFEVLAGAPAGTGDFTISNATATAPFGLPIALAPEASSLTVQAVEIVWPGDTNNDGATVSTEDIAPLAAFFGLTGVSRDEEDQGITWGARLTEPWAYTGSEPPAPTYDLAHTDANGDGTIDQADLLAVGVNIGRTPESASRPGMQRIATHSLGAARLDASKADGGAVATIRVEPLAADETVTVRLDLSAEAEEEALGVTTLWTVPAPLAVEVVQPGEWLDDGQLLALDAWTDSTRTLDAGAFRRRGASTLTGTGTAMTLRLVAESGLLAPVDLVLRRVQFGTTSGATAEIPSERVELAGSWATVSEESEGLSFDLALPSPNPSSGRVALSFSLDAPTDVLRLAVYDVLGREVALVATGAHAAGTHQIQLETGRLAPGAYVIHLADGRQTAVRSLTIVR